VKVIKKHRDGCDELDRAKFDEEMRILATIRHRNIIRLKDVYEDTISIKIVTELAYGGELFDRILKVHSFSERDVVSIARKLFHAVAYLHSRGIVHRDLKPENILFSTPDQNSDIKITDFGFARNLLSRPAALRARTHIGSYAYMAPEIYTGKPYDEKCDVWSLGVVIYIMISGLPPFVTLSPAEVADGRLHTTPFWVYTNSMVNSPSGAVDFPDHQGWQHISPAAKHFLAAVLELDPTKRMRSVDALNHPWLKRRATAIINTNPLPASTATTTSGTNTTGSAAATSRGSGHAHTKSGSISVAPPSRHNIHQSHSQLGRYLTFTLNKKFDLSKLKQLHLDEENGDSKGADHDHGAGGGFVDADGQLIAPNTAPARHSEARLSHRQSVPPTPIAPVPNGSSTTSPLQHNSSESPVGEGIASPRPTSRSCSPTAGMNSAGASTNASDGKDIKSETMPIPMNGAIPFTHRPRSSSHDLTSQTTLAADAAASALSPSRCSSNLSPSSVSYVGTASRRGYYGGTNSALNSPVGCCGGAGAHASAAGHVDAAVEPVPPCDGDSCGMNYVYHYEPAPGPAASGGDASFSTNDPIHHDARDSSPDHVQPSSPHLHLHEQQPDEGRSASYSSSSTSVNFSAFGGGPPSAAASPVAHGGDGSIDGSTTSSVSTTSTSSSSSSSAAAAHIRRKLRMASQQRYATLPAQYTREDDGEEAEEEEELQPEAYHSSEEEDEEERGKNAEA